MPSRRYEAVHLDLYCDTRTVELHSLLADGDRHVESVAGFLCVRVPPKRLSVYVFPTHWGLSLFLARECPRQWGRGAACFETPDGFVVAIASQWRRKDTLRYLRHELTHYVLASHFHDLPPWIDEGLAQYCESGEPFGQACHSRRERARTGVRMRDGRALESLVVVPAGGRLTRAQYAQAHALVCFFAEDERLGLEPILRYLRCVRSDGVAGEYFHRCFGAWPGDW